MGPTAWLARRWLRRRWIAVVPMALVVAVGATGTMLAFGAADRTANAYRHYLDEADVGDLVINPAVTTEEIAAVIRSLPGVERVTMSALLTVSFEESGPIPRPSPAEIDVIDERMTFTLGSADGRYLDMDRPAVHQGRLPTGPNEAAMTLDTAEQFGFTVGEVVPMSFWQFGMADGLQGAALEHYETEALAPIGVEQVTVVGIVAMADEVLPDELYPRQRVVVSPDLAARYDCVPPEPPPGVTLAEAVSVLIPDECAFAQHYFSLSLADGAAGVKPALEEFVRRSSQMNERLLDISDLGQVPGDPPQYFLIPTETQQDLNRVEGAVRPTVTALRALGLAAAVLTVSLTGLALGRELQRTRREQHQWQQLGMGAATRAVIVAVPAAAAIVAGVVSALPAAWLLDTGPVGLVSVMQPRPDRRIGAPAALSLAAVGAAALVLAAGLSWLSAHRAAAAGTGASNHRRRRRVPLRFGVVVSPSVRAAYRQRSAVPVVLATAVATAAFVAALSFGGSLDTLVSTPRSYGWPWHVAAMTGGGYGDLDVERTAELLDDDPAVSAWTALGFVSQVSLDGEPLTAALAPRRNGDAGLTVLEGTLPVAGDEVAIGATTADERGIGIGDTVELGGFLPARPATVTGIVVFPTAGPFGSDRVSMGTGLLLPGALFDAEDLADVRDVIAGLTAFVGVELREGARDDATVARLRDEISRLDRYGVPAVTYDRPVRPAEIIDAEDTRSVPVTVGAVFAIAVAVTLPFASWASVRARRRELAVLRTLGLTSGQLRQSVWVQSIAATAGALVVGVPFGAILGRALWRSFADELGVVPDPANPTGPMAASVIGGLVIAFLAAQVPGHIAARTSPAGGLRSE